MIKNSLKKTVNSYVVSKEDYLLMLSFNLFGNGLRDAFNPSLRGTED